MCGITGALSLNHNSIDVESAKPMCDAISHRGPDDAGYLFLHTGCRHKQKVSFELELTDDKFKHLSEFIPSIDSNEAEQKLNLHDWDLYLGHRRLSILDLSSNGHQPMSELSKNIWLSYNGEIYNFKTIRKELKAKGHHFFTQTDTEVIIYAYLEWGIRCVEKFNGMFAFALYDNYKKKLFIVRDRYGIKPVYYTIASTYDNKQTLLFASEVKSLLKYSDYKIDIDCEALMEYFTFQNIFSDKTLYKNIQLLPHGTYIELDLNESGKIQTNNDLNIKRYWDYNFQEDSKIQSESHYLEKLNFLFNQAVEYQMVSDVEVGSYLSGGMDSGAISCIASKQIQELKTFTIGFDLNSVSGMELAYDERQTSEYLSYIYRTEHYEMVLKSGDMERCLPKFAWHLEEPRVGQSYPNFYAAKLAGNFVKVVLSGTGGDELFGGYPWRYYRAVVNHDFEDYVDKYYLFWQRLIQNKDYQKVFKPIWNKIDHIWTRDIFKSVFSTNLRKPETPEEYVNQSLYFEAKTFLQGLLIVEDKLSMAHGLESRVPFMDNDLVDFAMKLPVKYKLGNLHKVIRLDENEIGQKRQKYFKKTNDGKLLLRKMMEKYVPSTITTAAKQGFSSPDSSWFKGDSIQYVKNRLLGKQARIYEYLDRNMIQGLINEHLTGKKNRRLLIWSLLNIEQWMETFID